MKIKDPAKLGQDAISIWKGTFSRRLSKEQSIMYNEQLWQVTVDLMYCKNNNKGKIPVKFDVLENMGIQKSEIVGGLDTSCVYEVC